MCGISKSIRASMRGALVSVTAGLLLAGCGTLSTGSASCGGNNFQEVTLQPGCAAICAEEPCAVYFRMPPGDGTYPVTGYAVAYGDYPAGQTVFLGSFWQGAHIVRIEGANVPPARLVVGAPW